MKWTWLLKVLMLGAALYFLIQGIDWQELGQLEIQLEAALVWRNGLLFVLIWAINLLLDALAWRKVESMVQKISLRTALLHNLKCYGLAFLTPLNSGEIAGRYLVQEQAENRRYALFLSLWTHLPKIFSKILVAWPILVYWLYEKGLHTWALLLALAWLASLILYFSLQKILRILDRWQFRQRPLKAYFKSDLPHWPLKMQVLLINALRFLLYSFQLILVLGILREDLLKPEVIAAVPVFYFLTAVVPSYASFDFLIKGAISVYFFAFLSAGELYFALASSLVWLANLGLPALVGLSSLKGAELARLKRKRTSPDSPHSREY